MRRRFTANKSRSRCLTAAALLYGLSTVGLRTPAPRRLLHASEHHFGCELDLVAAGLDFAAGEGTVLPGCVAACASPTQAEVGTLGTAVVGAGAHVRQAMAAKPANDVCLGWMLIPHEQAVEVWPVSGDSRRLEWWAVLEAGPEISALQLQLAKFWAGCLSLPAHTIAPGARVIKAIAEFLSRPCTGLGSPGHSRSLSFKCGRDFFGGPASPWLLSRRALAPHVVRKSFFMGWRMALRYDLKAQ
jgi:hypothetical protein